MIEKLLNRNSVRKFTEQEIEVNKINNLKEVINASPTTMNLQSFSAIFVTDKTTREALMGLN
jgi:nitroreductase